MGFVARRWVAAFGCTVLSLQLGLGAAHAQAPTAAAAGDTQARQDYAQCQARDEAAFREAVERLTLEALTAATRGLEYRPIVAEAWRRGGLDEVLAKRVDAALEDLVKETSWRERLTSLASKDTQEKLAKSAAERVFGSEEMKKGIADLAVGVGRTIGERLELATNDAAEPAARCLEAFLGPRYGRTVARVVATDAGREFGIDAAKAAAPVARGSVIAESKEGIAGLVALIMRRQIGNLSARVGQRLVGAVLGRVVSAVAGGIGVVLIAKDIWELRNGVLPIIGSEMKSPATRDKVHGELAQSIATEIDAHLREISRRTSERVIEIWGEFRRSHAKVLDLAERDSSFRAFIETVSGRNLGRLDEVVGLELAAGSEASLLKRVADGSLAEAVERWPAEALEIARDRRSLAAGFKWRALAGDTLLARVVEHEVHRRADPDRLTRSGLERILGLGDRIGTARLAALDRTALEPLLELDDASLRKLARALGEAELTALSGYIGALERKAGQKLLASVADVPGRMQAVTPGHVRQAIVASRDQGKALDLMLRSGELFDVGDFLRDVETVRSGAIAPQLLLARYPVAIGGLGVMAVVLLLLLGRVLFGRRPAVVRGAAET